MWSSRDKLRSSILKNYFNFKVDAINKEANDLEQGYGGDKKQEINDIKVIFFILVQKLFKKSHKNPLKGILFEKKNVPSKMSFDKKGKKPIYIGGA